MALGATQSNVIRDVLSQGLLLTGIGIVVGLIGAFSASRVVQSLLYGIGPNDAITFTAVALILAVVAIAASYIPARRASRVDPMVALRYE
jgi:putative ABC transport system permease protein